MQITRRRRLFESPESIALVDLVFLTLLFFLLSSSYFLERTAQIETERGLSEPPEKDIVVAVGVDGSVRLDGGVVSEEELPGMLAARLAQSREKSVTIRGEATVELGRIVRLMDLAREQGAQRVSLGTEQD
ncbi:MAG: biopolymer transporter ExbD [Candidatus Eisenbacteria bacterium]|nr:biopolymer transporter ExbD [Candidatus Eisenbacteria bacterium]